MRKCTIILLVLMVLGGLTFAGGSVDSVSDVIDITEEAVEQGQSVIEEREGNKKVTLSEAVETENFQLARRLIAEGENVNVFTSDGDPIIFKLIKTDHYFIGESLIDAGLDINLTDKNGKTALFIMMEQNISGNSSYTELFDKMIEAGANVNHIDSAGYTPLYSALNFGKPEYAKKLVDAGAIVDFSESSGKKIIQKVLSLNNNEYAKIISPAIQNANVSNSENQTLLDYVLHENNIKIAETFILDGASVYDTSKIILTNENINDYLIFAIKQTDTVLLENVVDFGFDVNASLEDNKTPLIIACENGSVETVKLLLEQGADIEALDVEGNTALMIASNNGFVEIVNMLIKNGAYIDGENNYGFTAINYAYSNNHIDIFNILLSNDADSKDIWFNACETGQLQFVQSLLINGEDVNRNELHSQNANSSTTGLIKAVRFGHLDVVEYLVENGASINITFEKVDQMGGSALSLAYENEYMEIFNYLLKKKADVNVIRSGIDLSNFRGHVDDAPYEYSSLMYRVIMNNDLETVKTLLEYNADIEKGKYDYNTWTASGTWSTSPLMLASSNGYVEITKVLIDAGADVNKTVKADYQEPTTALEAARNGGHTQIVNLLKRAGAEE